VIERAELRIEPARRLDALPTLELQRRVLAEGRWFVSRPEELAVSLAGREAQIEAAARSDRERFLVARLPGARVAGWLAVDVVPRARLAHVGRVELLVDPRFRRLGLGGALLDRAIRDARSGGALRKLSLAVFADNEGAIALYRSRGFVEEGRRRGEVRMEDGALRDDLLMALALD
jgi:ribosomal protein S18 acetylase RimI-like enzyme